MGMNILGNHLPVLLSILLCSVAKGLFTLAELALAESRTPRLRSRSEGGDKRYGRALEMAEHPDSALRALRTGMALADMAAGILGGILAAIIWKDFALSVAAAAAFMLLLAILRNGAAAFLARSEPEIILVRLLPLIRLLRFVFSPLLRIGSREASNRRGETGITEDELRLALQEGEKSGIVESEERTMVEGVFYLGDRPVGAFMTHRSEIQWLDIDASAEKARSMAVEHRAQQFFPVASGAVDEIVGIVSVQNILLAFLEDSWSGLKALMDPPHFVPETMSSIRAFEAFKRGDSAFLLVIDEYGGFAGALSVQDLMEEIVGELSASASADDAIVARDDGSYLADGSVNIDDIAEMLPVAGFPASPQEYHTLAGFILELAGEIPRTGAVFEQNGYRFTVVDMDGNRIDKVLIERKAIPEA
ncbi:MAG: hemolysin family protein [Treponema sp.]|jgi:putative hemolysin|nr:hemolysin family protein [Treponema sp.]